MSEIQYVIVGGNEHLRDLKCVPNHESSSSLTHGNKKGKKKREKKKHTHCTDHSHVLPLYNISPQRISLLNSELSDFHGGDITTDKPSTPQIVPGSPQSLDGIPRLRVEAEWGCLCRPHKFFHTQRSKETAAPAGNKDRAGEPAAPRRANPGQESPGTTFTFLFQPPAVPQG